MAVILPLEHFLSLFVFLKVRICYVDYSNSDDHIKCFYHHSKAMLMPLRMFPRNEHTSSSPFSVSYVFPAANHALINQNDVALLECDTDVTLQLYCILSSPLAQFLYLLLPLNFGSHPAQAFFPW